MTISDRPVFNNNDNTKAYSKPLMPIGDRLQCLIDNKTKPTGSLGVLEQLARQIGEIFNTTEPKIKEPHIIVFAADHGIAQHGVSAYPQAVTAQMLGNFLSGGAAINVFCKQHHIKLVVVDAGVNADFQPHANLINNKLAKGTRSFLHEPAMNLAQLHECLNKGAQVVSKVIDIGCNTIGFGEMGIGNTSSASVLMSLLCNIPIEQCLGTGTGVDEEQFSHKQSLLKQAIANYKGKVDLFSVLSYFGGFEILQMAGGMLEAHNKNALILVDGFISSVAFLIAFQIEPEIKRNSVFCHCSAEKGHRKLLHYLQVKELLQLDMRLGEGTACAVAFPLLKSAIAFLNEMASFESAGVSNRS